MFFFQAKPAALARNPFAEQPNPFQVGLNFHVNNECMIYNSTLLAFDFLLSIEISVCESLEFLLSPMYDAFRDDPLLVSPEIIEN